MFADAESVQSPPAPTTPDQVLTELLIAVGAGDQRAFRRLYDSISPILLGMLIRRLGRRPVAEEVLQECFLRIWQHAASFDPRKGHPWSWLKTLVIHRALDAIRARRPDEQGCDLDGIADEGSDADDPSRHAELAHQLDLLERSLQKLPLRARQSVLLMHRGGYTHRECARLLGAPMGTIKTWIRRGVEQLRHELAAAA